MFVEVIREALAGEVCSDADQLGHYADTAEWVECAEPAELMVRLRFGTGTHKHVLVCSRHAAPLLEQASDEDVLP